MLNNMFCVIFLTTVALFDGIAVAQNSNCNLEYFKKMPVQIDNPGHEMKKLFHEAASFLPQTIYRQGHQHFIGIPLAQLILDIQKTHVCVVQGKPLVGFGVRDNAVFLPEQKIVLINYERLKNLEGHRKQLLFFHEALGAMGYHDQNYQISSLFYLKAAQPSLKLPEEIENQAEQNNLQKLVDKNSSYKDQGGVTAVGGGGDGFTAEIKIALISLLIELINNKTISKEYKTKEFIERVMKLSIEPTIHIAEYRDIRAWPLFRIGTNRQSGKKSILIDKNFWSAVSDSNGDIDGANLELLHSILALAQLYPQQVGP